MESKSRKMSQVYNLEPPTKGKVCHSELPLETRLMLLYYVFCMAAVVFTATVCDWRQSSPKKSTLQTSPMTDFDRAGHP